MSHERNGVVLGVVGPQRENEGQEAGLVALRLQPNNLSEAQ